MKSAAIRKILLTLGCASFLFFSSCAGFGRQPALSSNQPPNYGGGMDPNYPYPPYEPYYNQYYQERRPSGPGIIHFYQVDGGYGKATIFMDGERIADLREKQYFTIRVRPGVHSFTVSKPGQGRIDFRVQSNRNYFVKNSERFGGGKEQLRLMNPQDGNYEISSMSPLMMKDIVRDDLLVRPRTSRRSRPDIYSGNGY